ncbi:MAG: aminotransferase class V-fold PLP-dependent enzyme [Hyphomicrobiales bacterium]
MPITDGELTALRADTPGVAHRVHLNNAGAALMPRPVYEAIQDHITLEVQIGGYEAAAQEAERCQNVYSSVSRLIGAAPKEIALVENATVAWQMAFHAIDFKPGDKIITARAEYGANYVSYLQKAKASGVEILVLPDDETGASDANALEAMIDESVKLISLTHIPTNGGLINPAAEIGTIAKKYNIPYLLDACQTAGQMPMNVEDLHCDFLSVTGRKFLRGPRATGFLYVRGKWLEGEASLEPPFIDHFAAPWVAEDRYELRADARRFENWENAYALRLGLGAAIDYALDVGLERIQERAFGLADELRYRLADISGVEVRDLGAERCAIVTFTHDGVEAGAIKQRAAGEGINISVSRSDSTRLDAEQRNLPDLARVSPHYYNTQEEIARFADMVRKIG